MNVIANIAQFTGLVKAYASTDNPLQTIVDLVITPFSVNKNNQAIPRAEASNILRTCLHQPVKIDLDGQTIGGHKGAYPVGTITSAEETDTAIIGKGIIWNEEYPEVSEYLKKRTAENNPPGTSWEILFQTSEVTDGIEYLRGTYYAANTIVANPSYGTETLIRAIAEDLKLGETLENEEEVQKAEGESLETEREEIVNLQKQLWAMYEALDKVYYQTFEIEEAEAAKTENVETFTNRFTELLAAMQTRANDAGVALAETKTTVETLQAQLTTIQAELDTLKAEKAQAELDKKIADRETALAEIGVSLEENKDVILTLDDTAFNVFVSGIKQVQTKFIGGKGTAEIKINLPDPVTTQDIDTSEIIQSHKALFPREVK